MSILANCGQVATLYNCIIGQDADGSPTYALGTIALDGIPCDLQPEGGALSKRFGQHNFETPLSCYFPYDINALPTQILVVNFPITGDSARTFIIRNYQNEVERNTLYVANLEEWTL